ncbi:MAG: response regulator transcription factor [Bdellovibrionaceae bacterium]|nr:response regulator transcription factor [Pseudobdellovibrionaceae bacterium]NUM59144.1 response regulator transcription factor [Pseudobdellovibrionaceae bacterium]
MKNILLVDDHPFMRRGIRTVFAESTDYKIAAEAAMVSEALELLSKQEFDIAIVDVSLPDGSGLSLLKYLVQQKPHIRTIILTMHKEDPYLAKAVQLGASAYLVKDMAPELLLETIEKVVKGEKVFHVSTKVATVVNESVIMPKGSKLSEREKAVLELLHQGKTLTQIADLLELNVKTVFTYRIRILNKLGLKNNEELMQKLRGNEPEIIKLLI